MATLRLGDTAPDFTADSSLGLISFHQYIADHWAVLFSHPADFTPVCTTELGETAKLKAAFEQRGVKVLALSVDTAASHLAWIGEINETQQTSVEFPVIADTDRRVATLYDMIHPDAADTFTVRSVFIIGPDKKIKLMMTYPAATGRNFTELIRVIDSLQLTLRYPVATPANWQQGDEVIVAPGLPEEEARQRFPAGLRKVNAYLRYTRLPESDR